MGGRAGHVDELRERYRLAVVQRLDLRELLGVLLHRVGQRANQSLAPRGRHRCPRTLSERRARRLHRPLHVLLARLRNSGNLTAGGGIECGEHAPVSGL